MTMMPLLVLDLAPVPAGGTAGEALRESLALARKAEHLGYTRYWFAEHHGMPSIAGAAPEILIAHVAAGTERIRVGSGGIMLPNHVPLKVAESFHTLEALHPGRTDLGIGRAPGTDRTTMRALRPFEAERFPELLTELLALSRGQFPAGHPFHKVRVIPANVSLPPIWILGSSGATAALAASLGTGYSFASHFSPASPMPAIRAYHASFRPSERFPTPHVILGAAVVCAQTDERAAYLASPMDLVWVRLQRGGLGAIPSPEEALAYPYTPQERAWVDSRRALQIDAVRARLTALVEATGADEIMISTTTYDAGDRARSYELVAKAFGMRAAGEER